LAARHSSSIVTAASIAHGSPFVQLIRASDTGAVIEVRIGRTAIQVQRRFDAELLRAVIELLREIVG
jgi:hypothetical protein